MTRRSGTASDNASALLAGGDSGEVSAKGAGRASQKAMTGAVAENPAPRSGRVKARKVARKTGAGQAPAPESVLAGGAGRSSALSGCRDVAGPRNVAGRRRMGRPTAYSEEIAQEICMRIVEGESLQQICLDPLMPAARTVYNWLENPVYKGFRTRYARARQRAAEVFEDEILDVARGATPEDAAARKVHITTLQWIMARRAPRVYGDKVMQEITGAEGGAVEVQAIRRVIVDPQKP